jgi:hypothetical protein
MKIRPARQKKPDRAAHYKAYRETASNATKPPAQQALWLHAATPRHLKKPGPRWNSQSAEKYWCPQVR